MLENSPRILRNWSSFALPRSIWDNSLNWDLFARKKKLAKCAQKNLFNTYSWHTSPLYPELENTLHGSIIRKWTFHNALRLNGATRPLDESQHVMYSRYCDHRHHNPSSSRVKASGYDQSTDWSTEALPMDGWMHMKQWLSGLAKSVGYWHHF